jgi:hypothetical protein
MSNWVVASRWSSSKEILCINIGTVNNGSCVLPCKYVPGMQPTLLRRLSPAGSAKAHQSSGCSELPGSMFASLN